MCCACSKLEKNTKLKTQNLISQTSIVYHDFPYPCVPYTDTPRFPPLLRIFGPIPRVTLGRPFHARLANKHGGAANDRATAKGGGTVVLTPKFLT